MSVNINMNLETAALPVFRLMGMAIPICLSREADDMELAWERWHESSLKDTLPAFSKSVYVLRHLYHSTGYILIIGYLVSNDAPLPEGACEWYVAPQVYQVATLPEASCHAAAEAWQRLAALPERRFAVDFESHPSWGASKVYVGVAGEVTMAEEGLDD